VSGDGAVWISPFEFFQVVATMRQRATLREGQAALVAPDVAHGGGTSNLQALVTSVGEARTMLAANLEIAGRALVVAGTRTVDADVVEEGVGSFWELPAPYNMFDAPTDNEGYDDWVEDGEQYYEDFDDFMDEAAEIVEGEGD
jgi:hypothetical protein